MSDRIVVVIEYEYDADKTEQSLTDMSEDIRNQITLLDKPTIKAVGTYIAIRDDADRVMVIFDHLKKEGL
jgi:hypothetical protein